MKKFDKSKIFLLGFCALLLVTLTGCPGSRPQGPWDEDHQTYYSSSTTKTVDDFIALDDEDLQPQFKEFAHLSANDLGEDGAPGVDQFSNPNTALASLFTPIFFNTDKYDIHKNDLKSLSKMATYLKQHPNTHIIIEGHCDERGPEAYNQSLGTKRARSIESQLIKEGVNPKQLHPISYGKEKPFALGHTQADWAQNRRGHFLIKQQ
jgi:peptidoglycan-associated lipoprotein